MGVGVAVTQLPDTGAEDGIELSRMRKTIGSHMVQSLATSPHVGMGVEVDFSAVDRAREKLRTAWRAREGFGLSYLPFIAHAICRGLGEFPHLNATIDGDRLVVHPAVNLGIAVDLDFEGLIVPVVHNAGAYSVASLAREIARLAAAAREGGLRIDDVSGGTYTVSNPGPFGTAFTIPIINQPQVAIMSTDGVRPRPWVDAAHPGTPVVRPIGQLIQSFDHRAVDGAYSAAFLDHVRTVIESTDWLAQNDW